MVGSKTRTLAPKSGAGPGGVGPAPQPGLVVQLGGQSAEVAASGAVPALPESGDAASLPMPPWPDPSPLPHPPRMQRPVAGRTSTRWERQRREREQDKSEWITARGLRPSGKGRRVRVAGTPGTHRNLRAPLPASADPLFPWAFPVSCGDPRRGLSRGARRMASSPFLSGARRWGALS